MAEGLKKPKEIGFKVWAAVLLVVLIILPFILRAGWLSLVTEIIIMGLAACAVNLVLGYGGMVHFGPAGLYGVGAYVTALLLTKANSPFVLAMIAGPIAAGCAGFLIGWFCVRRTAVYFALLTLAFAQILWTIVHQWYRFTGGDDGIVGIPMPSLLMSVKNYYYFSLIIVVACLIVLWRICHSPFGKMIQAIRENPERVEFVGTDVRQHRLKAFTFSSIFLGIAGSLFCGFSQNVFPDYVNWVKSTDMLVICLLGGIYNYSGPIVGSVVYILLNKIISNYTEYWMLILGLIIMLLVVFVPGGIMGFLSERFASGPQEEKKDS